MTTLPVIPVPDDEPETNPSLEEYARTIKSIANTTGISRYHCRLIPSEVTHSFRLEFTSDDRPASIPREPAPIGILYSTWDSPIVECISSYERIRNNPEIILRARNLLIDCISPEQFEFWRFNGFIEIVAQSGTVYRIHRTSHRFNTSDRLIVISLDEWSNRADYFCLELVSQSEYVLDDKLLSVFLMIKFSEKEFLKKANRI